MVIYLVLNLEQGTHIQTNLASLLTNPIQRIKVTFKDAKGAVLKTIEASEGDSLLDIAKEYDIDFGELCDGSNVRSTRCLSGAGEPETQDDKNDVHLGGYVTFVSIR